MNTVSSFRGGTLNRGAVSAFMQIVRHIDLPSGEDMRVPCRDTDEDVWFPQQGGRGPTQARIARETCFGSEEQEGCGIREQCLERAMAFERGLGREVRFGIWGGLTPPQRAALAKKRAEERRNAG